MTPPRGVNLHAGHDPADRRPRGAMTEADARLRAEARARPEPCGICGGRTELLGDLGALRWSRCQACGSEQSERVEAGEGSL